MRQTEEYKLCVFCSSRSGCNPIFEASVVALGQALAFHKLGLVFAGSGNGTMGKLAQVVKEHGGHVTGIIVPSVRGDWQEFTGLDERHEVADIQEGKLRMFDLSDGFIALPGGFNVLDPLMEHLTWMQRDKKPKPVYLVNTSNYWDHLLEMFVRMKEQDFLPEGFEKRFIVLNSSVDAVEAFVNSKHDRRKF